MEPIQVQIADGPPIQVEGVSAAIIRWLKEHGAELDTQCGGQFRVNWGAGQVTNVQFEVRKVYPRGQ
jgi:hypothetical protein